MSKPSTSFRKLTEEYQTLREQLEENIKSTISIARELIGVDVTILSDQEYDDNNYYSYIRCLQIGVTQVSLTYHDVVDLDVDVASEAIKRCKADPDKKEEVLEMLDDEVVQVTRACVENSLDCEALIQGLAHLLDIPGEFHHLLV
nr:hypothetical protein BdHM001_35970 [Bdellovibrio sp. HM001]